MDYLGKINDERQGERYISVGDIAQGLHLTRVQQLDFDATLKEHAAQYWLEHGGNPNDLRHGPQLVRQLSLTGSNTSEPAYSLTFVNDLIAKGTFEAKPGLLDAPFFKLPKEDQQAVMDNLAKGEPIQVPEGKTSAVERLAIRAGLKDEIIR